MDTTIEPDEKHDMSGTGDKPKSWVEAELEDSFDEELEMEIDDDQIARELKSITDLRHMSLIDRHFYFHELFRLQAELVKLQDWVQHTKYKLVVLSRAATPPARVA